MQRFPKGVVLENGKPSHIVNSETITQPNVAYFTIGFLFNGDKENVRCYTKNKKQPLRF